MIAIQVHITAGPTAGQRLQLNQSPVSFGRAPDNALVLDLPVVSRNHGELRLEGGQWQLVNLSQNGTRLNRKRVTSKPRPLTDGASIVIGETEVFRVTLLDSADTADNDQHNDSDDEQAPAKASAGTGLKNRSKLWLMLGVWFALCIGLFIFLATLGGDDTPQESGSSIVIYTNPSQVQDVLNEPLDKLAEDNYAYTENLRHAREAITRGDITDMYDAFEYYRQAERYLPASRELDPIDQQHMKDAENRLTREIYELYDQARLQLQSQQYEQCLQTINRLMSIYRNPNSDHPLVNSILKMREVASSRVR